MLKKCKLLYKVTSYRYATFPTPLQILKSEVVKSDVRQIVNEWLVYVKEHLSNLCVLVFT